MKISSQNTLNKYNQPAFTGKRLFPLNLLKKTAAGKEVLPAYFTRLTQSDVPLISEVRSTWHEGCFSGIITYDFLANASISKKPKNWLSKLVQPSRTVFFMVEAPKLSDNVEKVRSLTEVQFGEKMFYLSYLQSASSLKKEPTVFGAGISMIFGLSKLAEKLKLKGLRLKSATVELDDWYKKMGFEEISAKSEDLFMPAQKFKAFQKLVIDKYGVAK